MNYTVHLVIPAEPHGPDYFFTVDQTADTILQALEIVAPRATMEGARITAIEECSELYVLTWPDNVRNEVRRFVRALRSPDTLD